MKYNNFHNTWGYPKDITSHGMKHYVDIAVANMNCGCCNHGCKCNETKQPEDKKEEPAKPEQDKPKEEEVKCTDKALENYIDPKSIDEKSDFETPCKACEETKVSERDKSEPLCTNECMNHTTGNLHIEDIMKKFKNLDENDPCPIPTRTV